MRENARVGELRIRPVDGSTFAGYGPTFDEKLEWINTGDIITIDNSGNVELLANKEDLIVDKSGKILEHWTLEKAICAYDQIKGAQVGLLNERISEWDSRDENCI
ncbi:unnamed protein product [Toxocara canis]|uniref:4-hydroxy-4-methyl-2-oxoglutarate aldolase n=1 Tax=Toxocara canis TaxID=6265 RepID=A0A183U5F1_TOXCA|nr:unnamed protein product [Toxocara canis]